MQCQWPACAKSQVIRPRERITYSYASLSTLLHTMQPRFPNYTCAMSLLIGFHKTFKKLLDVCGYCILFQLTAVCYSSLSFSDTMRSEEHATSCRTTTHTLHIDPQDPLGSPPVRYEYQQCMSYFVAFRTIHFQRLTLIYLLALRSFAALLIMATFRPVHGNVRTLRNPQPAPPLQEAPHHLIECDYQRCVSFFVALHALSNRIRVGTQLLVLRSVLTALVMLTASRHDSGQGVLPPTPAAPEPEINTGLSASRFASPPGAKLKPLSESTATTIKPATKTGHAPPLDPTNGPRPMTLDALSFVALNVGGVEITANRLCHLIGGFARLPHTLVLSK